jgi:hypothetical protein
MNATRFFIETPLERQYAKYEPGTIFDEGVQDANGTKVPYEFGVLSSEFRVLSDPARDKLPLVRVDSGNDSK